MKLPTYTLFIGNPGVGKSTLLNAIIGSVQFESGVSIGTGLTRRLQLYQASDDTVIYGDTPGLDDLENRKLAAEEIKLAFQQDKGGLIKLVFVVTTESGRVRASDMATIRLVLDALPDKSIPFGILVNKVSQGLRLKLATSVQAREDFVRSFACLGPEYSPPKLMFYERMDNLDDQENVVHDPAPTLLEFLDDLEATLVQPERVQDIKHQMAAELLEELEKERAKKKADISGWSTFVDGLGMGAGAAGMAILGMILSRN
ncbi:GTPase Era [Seminavis robusta]|uniref:GTPase Era n=1 Tax=Seminavis robusta TaxID=568900 RepID=A0A9N8HK09_9STRA|nr:GTPase Era [Seminavis robusta]|eukprot:Sro585_g170970.1 GTPase Era (259) ;mRNA; r:19583-20454